VVEDVNCIHLPFCCLDMSGHQTSFSRLIDELNLKDFPLLSDLSHVMILTSFMSIIGHILISLDLSGALI